MRQKTMMTVRAAEGLRVPREDDSRRYIEQEPVEVPRSPYYLRCLTHLDLVMVEATTAAESPKAKRAAKAAAPAAPAAPAATTDTKEG